MIKFLKLSWPLALFFVYACSPISEKYVAFHGDSFSERETPAKVYSGSSEELINDGYLLIGYSDYTQDIQTCFNGLQCRPKSEIESKEGSILKDAAAKGGDLVTILERDVTLVPESTSICNYYTTTSWTDNKGNTHYIKTCASSTTYSGHKEIWTRRALIWRKEPQLATAKANYRAFHKAKQILEQTYNVKKEDETDNSKLSISEQLPGQAKLSKSLFNKEANQSKSLRTLVKNIEPEKAKLWRDKNDRNLFMAALKDKDWDLVWELLKFDIDWTHIDKQGLRTIDYLLVRCSPEQCERVFTRQAGIKEGLKDSDKLYKVVSFSRNPDIFNYLKQKNIPLNNKFGQYDSHLLITLSMYNSHQIANLLKLYPNLINKPDNRGFTAIFYAASAGNLNAMKILIDKGAKFTKKINKDTLLHIAVESNKPEVINYVTRLGIPLNTKGKNELTALYRSIFMKKWRSYQAIKRLSPDYHAPEKILISALKKLLEQDDPSLFESFLSKVDFKSMPKNLLQSLLAYAVVNQKSHHIDAIVKKGANVNFIYKNTNLLSKAIEYKNMKLVKTLIRNGAQVSGLSLQQAVINGDAFMVKIIREHQFSKTH